MVPVEQEAVRRATDACLRLLAVRGRSRHELEQALVRKGFEAPVREAVLEKLKGWGYLDDERFARDRAAALLRQGRLGPRAVLQRLRAHGLEGDTAQAALAEASGSVGFDALSTARRVLEGRGLLGRTLSLKERARAARLLLSRGFSGDILHQLLGEELLEQGGGED